MHTFSLIIEGTTKMQYESMMQPAYNAQRPRSDESMQICKDIAEWQNQGYIARGFGIKHQAVGKWFDRVCQDIFKRMRDFVIGLVEDGRPDLALRILRYICGGIGYKPVKKPPKLIQFLSLFQAHCQHQTEAAELSVMFFEIIKDGVFTLNEIKQIRQEFKEGRQALDDLDAAFGGYEEICIQNGGQVRVKADEFTAKIAGT